MIRLGYFQFNPVFGEITHNTNKIIRELRKAEADIIVLPELAFTGYYFKDADEVATLAEEPSHSQTVKMLTALCREKDFYLVTGFAEKAHEKVFNSALLVGPDGLLHVYRKLHLFNTEKSCFTPGDKPLEVQCIRGVKIGMMICFDWIFPEVSRILTVKGADIICHPANLVLDYCQQAMLARCIENNVFAVTANRYGADKRPHGSIRFTGKSQIVAPKGKRLRRAPSQKEQLAITAVNPDEARNKFLTPVNHLTGDRRPESYTALVQ